MTPMTPTSQPTNAATPTPRTDSHVLCNNFDGPEPTPILISGRPVVSADFACQLECALTRMTASKDAWWRAWDSVVKETYKSHEDLRAQLYTALSSLKVMEAERDEANARIAVEQSCLAKELEKITTLRAQLKEVQGERDYLKDYVIPEKDKHGKYWHDLAQERIAQLTEARQQLARAEGAAEGAKHVVWKLYAAIMSHGEVTLARAVRGGFVMELGADGPSHHGDRLDELLMSYGTWAPCAPQPATPTPPSSDQETP